MKNNFFQKFEVSLPSLDDRIQMIKARFKKTAPISENQFGTLGEKCEGFTPFYILQGVKDSNMLQWMDAHSKRAKFRFIKETGKYVLDEVEGQPMDFSEIEKNFDKNDTPFEDLLETFRRFKRQLELARDEEREAKEKEERYKVSSFFDGFRKLIYK